MNFIYRKNYEKCLDDGCRRDLTSSTAHNMLWSAVRVSPPSALIQSSSLIFAGPPQSVGKFGERIIRERLQHP